MSDLHPTNTMGVEGERVVKDGTQYVMALKREEREEMEKQSRNASVVIKTSLLLRFTVFSLLVSSDPEVFFTWNMLGSLNSHISNLVLLLPTK